MRIAAFSDIHGNAAALRAVLKAIDLLGADRLLCMGDLVGRGPDPEGVVRLLAERPLTWIRGNWDEWVTGAPGWDARPKRKAYVSAARADLTPESLAWLKRALPTHAFTVESVRIHMAHGSPRDPMEHLTASTSTEVLREALAGVEADVFLLGHSHHPFVRNLDDRTVINCGTVGYPFSGDPRAHFVLLEGPPVKASIYSVSYSLQRNLRRLDKSVARGVLAEKYAHRYRRALLGDSDTPLLPSNSELPQATATLQLISALAHPLGEDSSARVFAQLYAALNVLRFGLDPRHVRALMNDLARMLRIAERRESLRRLVTWQRSHPGGIETFPRDWGEVGVEPIVLDNTLARRIAIRARRYERAFDRWCHDDARIRIGLRALDIGMSAEPGTCPAEGIARLRTPAPQTGPGVDSLGLREQVATTTLLARLGVIPFEVEEQLRSAWHAVTDLDTLLALDVGQSREAINTGRNQAVRSLIKHLPRPRSVEAD